MIKHKKFNKTKGYNYEYISLEDILPVADFLFDIYEIYPSSTVNVEQKEAILSFRMPDSDDLVVVSMVLPEKTNAQVKDNCQMQGAIDTYVTRYLLRKALGICDYSDDVDNLPQGGGGGKKQQNKTQAVNTDAKASDGFSNMIDDPTDLDPSMIFNDKQCLKNSTIINWAKKQTKQMLNTATACSEWLFRNLILKSRKSKRSVSKNQNLLNKLYSLFEQQAVFLF